MARPPILGMKEPTLQAKKRMDGGIEIQYAGDWDALALFAVGAMINRTGNAILDERDLIEAMQQAQPQTPEAKPS